MANYYGSLITEVIHPFGRVGTGNTTGAIYGTTVSTAASSVTQVAIETVTVPLPVNAMITELEYGLTLGMTITVTTDAPKPFWYIANSPVATTTATTGALSLADTLVSLTSTQTLSVVSTTTLVDMTVMGRSTPSSGTYFNGKGSFDLALYLSASATTSKAAAAMKQSSYVQYSYYLIG